MSFTQPVAEAQPRPTAVIPLSSIDASPFNPRKDFDKEGLDELAASIKKRGLLENLVVRPVAGGRFQLMGGERRFRALQQIKAADAKCNIIEADDAQAMAIQIVENLQRKDLGPLEEAEAFAKLQAQDPKTWTPQAIAKAVGKTDRFVQQRIAMHKNLSPEATKLVKDGKIKIEVARVLAGAPKSIQKEILKDSYFVEEMDADEARREISSHAVALDRAGFDVKLYDGEWIEDGKEKMFADIDKFDALQKKAAEAMVAEIKTRWPDAKLLTTDSPRAFAWGDTKDCVAWTTNGKKKAGQLKVPKEKCTAIVWIDSGRRLLSAEGVIAMSQLNPVRNSNSGGSSVTRKQETPTHKAGRLAYNDALRAAIAKKTDFALKLTALWMVISASNGDVDEDATARLMKVLPEPLAKLVDGRFYSLHDFPKALASIDKLKPAEITLALGELAAAELGWSEHEGKPSALVDGLAKQFGVKFVEPKPEPPPAPKKAGHHEGAVKVVTPAKTAPKAAAKAKAKKAPKAKAKAKKKAGK